jgi:sec-independent protein translocase protein TatC
MAEQVKNKRAQKGTEAEMSFWEHLEELRWHLFRAVLVLFLLAIAAFIFREFIFDQVILAPKNPDFVTYRILCRLGELISVDSLCLGDIDLKIINITMAGQFTTHLYISFITALVVAFPYVIWEIWSFVRPALLPKEKKYSRGAVFFSTLLFILGMMFSYYLIVPLTVNFFSTYQVSESVVNNITLSSYIGTVVSVTLATGLVFELPIFVFFLTKVGILTPAFMKRNRKYVLIILLTISAIITPPDIASQILVTIPLMLLYEFSIYISSRVIKNKPKESESSV